MAITTSQITITTMEGWYSGATPPLNPLIGDLWLDTTNNEIKKYDGTNWIKQADTQGPPGPQGDSMVSREAYWIKSSITPEPPDPETGDMKGWTKGSEPPESALDGIQSSDKFWRIYREIYSNGESEYSKYSEVELIGSYEILNGLVQFRNGVTTTENGITVIDGGKIHTKSIKADRIQVEDLEALKATIGGFHIGKNSIYSGTKQTIDSTERGIYFDSNGQSYFGDDKNFIRFYQSDNDNYKLQISADSLTFGSGISVEQTFKDIKGDIQNAQDSANNAQSAADKAKDDAATALSTANTAKTNADAAQAAVGDAAKTATNFLDFNSTNGLLIGNKKSGAWSGYRSQILSGQFNILDENGNLISSFGANKIGLGNNNPDATIEFCGGEATLENIGMSTYLEKVKSLSNGEKGISDLQLVAGGSSSLTTGLGVGSVIRWTGYDGDDASIGGRLLISALKNSASAKLRANYSEAGSDKSAIVTCNVTTSASDITMSADKIQMNVGSSGATISGGLTVSSGASVSGNITVSKGDICLDNSRYLYGYYNGNKRLTAIGSTGNIYFGERSGTGGMYAYISKNENYRVFASTDENECFSSMMYNGHRYFRSQPIYDRTSGSNKNVFTVKVDSNGYLFRTSSSMRYKENITTKLNPELDPERLYDLNVWQYNYRDEHFSKDNPLASTTYIGFIAEDVKQHYPIAALINDEGYAESWDERTIIPPMLKLIQNQHKEIELLKQQVNSLMEGGAYERETN